MPEQLLTSRLGGHAYRYNHACLHNVRIRVHHFASPYFRSVFRSAFLRSGFHSCPCRFKVQKCNTRNRNSLDNPPIHYSLYYINHSKRWCYSKSYYPRPRSREVCSSYALWLEVDSISGTKFFCPGSWVVYSFLLWFIYNIYTTRHRVSPAQRRDMYVQLNALA